MTITRNARRAARFALAVLLSLPLVSSASAQDNADRKAERIDRLAEALDLTDAQKQIFADANAEPGALWNVAAALTPTLTAEQKATLFTRPERPDGAKREGKRGRRGDRMQGDRAERREEAHEAMQSALNLTDAQVAELEALHEARRAEREQRMKDRAAGELSGELAGVLTPAQQEVFKVHRALAMRMHRGHRGSGRRGDHRGR